MDAKGHVLPRLDQWVCCRMPAFWHSSVGEVAIWVCNLPQSLGVLRGKVVLMIRLTFFLMKIIGQKCIRLDIGATHIPFTKSITPHPVRRPAQPCCKLLDLFMPCPYLDSECLLLRFTGLLHLAIEILKPSHFN